MKVDSLDGAAPSRTRCDRLQPMHKILHKWCRRHTIRTQLVQSNEETGVKEGSKEEEEET
uniref:Uncharacterized protein n=1 Tax=Solanum lycopersicum TaxID=4081 RepID=A0A3Q7EMG1_SOLLC